MEDIQELTGMFADGFYVNTDVIDFIDAVLSAPANLIGIGKIKKPVIIDRALCVRTARLHYIYANISHSPIKREHFYVSIGLLNFIYRVLYVSEMLQTIDNTMLKKDYLLKLSNHPLVSSVITVK